MKTGGEWTSRTVGNEVWGNNALRSTLSKLNPERVSKLIPDEGGEENHNLVNQTEQEGLWTS